MSQTTPILITKVLDALSLRSVATAQNIANSSSRTYQPLRVAFEDKLMAAARQGDAAIERLPLEITRDRAIEAEPRLDLELATASETTMRYAALIDVLGRELQIAHTVVRGGQ